MSRRRRANYKAEGRSAVVLHSDARKEARRLATENGVSMDEVLFTSIWEMLFMVGDDETWQPDKRYERVPRGRQAIQGFGTTRDTEAALRRLAARTESKRPALIREALDAYLHAVEAGTRPPPRLAI